MPFLFVLTSIHHKKALIDVINIDHIMWCKLTCGRSEEQINAIHCPCDVLFFTYKEYSQLPFIFLQISLSMLSGSKLTAYVPVYWQAIKHSTHLYPASQCLIAPPPSSISTTSAYPALLTSKERINFC